MSDEHFQAGKREVQPSPNLSASPTGGEARVICLRCCRSTDSLKSLNAPNVVCVLLYVVWNTETMVACPACLRQALRRKMVAAIPLANLLFPLVWAIYLVQMIRAGSPGHSSKEVAEAHRLTPDQLMEYMPQVINLRKPPRRERLILAVILLFVVGIWGVGYFLKNQDSGPKVDGQTLSQWLKQLEHPAAGNRLIAVEAIVKLGPKALQAVPALKAHARGDEELQVRREAYRALVAIDPASANGIPIPAFQFPDFLNGAKVPIHKN